MTEFQLDVVPVGFDFAVAAIPIAAGRHLLTVVEGVLLLEGVLPFEDLG